MRRFLLGMLAGAILGGGAVWLALERPWRSGGRAAAVAGDAGVAAVEAARQPGKGRGRGRGTLEAPDGPVELTDADLAMVWKGDTVELPARDVDLGDTSDARALSSAEINQVIHANSQPVSDCLSAAAGDAELKAQITVKLLVNGRGRVDKVRVHAPAYLLAHGLHACLRTAALDFSFPATGAPTVVSAPYDLY